MGIDSYCFNVSFLFQVSFCLLIIDCAALETSAKFFEMVHLLASFTLPPICMASTGFMANTTKFASSPCGHFNRCACICLYFLALIIFDVLHQSSLPHSSW